MKTLPKLQFITQPVAKYSTSELIEQACLGGIKLIQLRLKNVTENEIYREAKLGAEICKKHKATFILNDYLSIAKDLDLDGVHLGKTDRSPILAREILGKSKLIGGTANEYADILNLIKAKVNYIGLGPFRFTKTKAVLSPTLGLDGYSEIIKKLEDFNCPPIYAIGGIENDDINPILETGVYGIAVSGLIANADDVVKASKEILELF